MAINKYNIKKWYKMLIGKSSLHIKQGIGKIYSKEDIKGYYNDLTLKVESEKNIQSNIPLFLDKDGKLKEFSIMIFQYGLGAYDLYLLGIDKRKNLERFKAVLEWAVKAQQESGGWLTFSFKKGNDKYSAMAQGEGISLLLRGYIELKDERYLNKAKQAINFLMKPIENGGTTLYCNEDIYLKEYLDEPVVLNGWIFSLWGIYDYLKVDRENNEIKSFYQKTLNTLERNLIKFDKGYWSMYDMSKRIASPFYHELHVQQLKVMYDITGKEAFKQYAEKFEGYNTKFLYRKKAFFIKAIQKIMEK